MKLKPSLGAFYTQPTGKQIGPISQLLGPAQGILWTAYIFKFQSDTSTDWWTNSSVNSNADYVGHTIMTTQSDLASF